ncbi:hypothetical protein QBC41DRAFT_297712 [Cercophora samala]|uniref:Uncharacterized protein n=1 Tax=Cercophora samala TaxID=330535 RepID=A0AA39ZNY3_9PEZI|nr:hypothetical protein QBC41DRAFT_297712 [Cercophora samala]
MAKNLATIASGFFSASFLFPAPGCKTVSSVGDNSFEPELGFSFFGELFGGGLGIFAGGSVAAPGSFPFGFAAGTFASAGSPAGTSAPAGSVAGFVVENLGLELIDDGSVASVVSEPEVEAEVEEEGGEVEEDEVKEEVEEEEVKEEEDKEEVEEDKGEV